jgi:hypothetical protein
LVKTGAEDEGQPSDIMKITAPDGLGDIGNLGLSPSEAKLSLAGIQGEVVATRAKHYAVRRPDCHAAAAFATSRTIGIMR